MIRRFLFAALAALTLSAAPARAQSSAPNVTQAARVSVHTLQDDDGPPHSARAVRHVAAAYAFAWLSIFGYAFTLTRRYRRLRDEELSLGSTV